MIDYRISAKVNIKFLVPLSIDGDRLGLEKHVWCSVQIDAGPHAGVLLSAPPIDAGPRFTPTHTGGR